MRTLLIVADSDVPSGLSPCKGELVALPLTPEATFAVVKSGLPNVLPRWGHNYERQLALNDKVSALLSSALQDDMPQGRAAREYELSVVASNVVLWRERIRAVVGSAEFTSIIVPALSRSACQVPCAGLDDYGRILRLILAEELHSLGWRAEDAPQTFNRDRDASGADSRPRYSLGHIGTLRRFIVRAAKVSRESLFARKPGDFIPRMRRDVRVLVIAQPSKAHRLRAGRHSGVTFTFLDYQDFHARVSDLEVRKMDCDCNASVEAILSNLSASRANADRLSNDALDSLARGNWDVLITDAQHDSTVQKLVEVSLDIGKRVAVIPEGCVSYTGLLAPFARGLFIRDSRLTRFTLNQRQSDFWEGQDNAQRRVLVSGYLGDTDLRMTLRVRILGALLNWRLRRLARPPGTPIAFLTFDTFLINSEAGRFGQSSYSEALLDLLQIVDALVHHGIVVIARARDERLAGELNILYSGKPAFFTSRIPWQLLAHRATVVITRDSSIGWEATQLGLKVLIWNFSDYPAFAEETLSGTQTVHVPVAQDTAQLVKAVFEACQAQPSNLRPQDSGSNSDRSQEGVLQVIHWIHSPE